MTASKPRVSKQRSIDAAVTAFTIACADLPIRFTQDGHSEMLDGYDRTEYESILINLMSATTTLLTLRAFTVARVWNSRLKPFHGQGRAVLRRLFPLDWKKREVQVYEWCRIVKLVPLDDINYELPWEYYRKRYGRASGNRRARWEDGPSYRDGNRLVFIEIRNGREEIHSRSVSEIMAALANHQTGEVIP